MKTLHLFICLIVAAILTANIAAEQPPISSARTIGVIFCAAFGAVALLSWAATLVCHALAWLLNLWLIITDEYDAYPDSDY